MAIRPSIICGIGLTWVACTPDAGSSNPDRSLDISPFDLVRFDESFIVGARPISVLMVRHAEPSELELDYSRRVGDAWLDGLVDHEAPWRIGVLPVGADLTVVPSGGLVKGASGSLFVSDGHPDPYELMSQLLDPIEGSPGVNPIFSTLNAMTARPENDALFLRSGLFVVHVVSAFEDASHAGAKDEFEVWLTEDLTQGWAATEFNVATNMEGSSCMGGESDRLLGMVEAVGGFEQDICDETSPQRSANTYTASMTSHQMKLSHEPYRFSIEVTSPDYRGPALEQDVDFSYSQLDRTVTLLTWQPEALTPVWVSYVPKL